MSPLWRSFVGRSQPFAHNTQLQRFGLFPKKTKAYLFIVVQNMAWQIVHVFWKKTCRYTRLHCDTRCTKDAKVLFKSVFRHCQWVKMPLRCHNSNMIYSADVVKVHWQSHNRPNTAQDGSFPDHDYINCPNNASLWKIVPIKFTVLETRQLD